MLRGRGGRGVCGQNFCYNGAAFVILLKLICNMTCSENEYFDLLTPTAGSGGRGGSVGKNICYHAASFVDSL